MRNSIINSVNFPILFKFIILTWPIKRLGFKLVRLRRATQERDMKVEEIRINW
jgi:hypothetical protein